MGATFPINNIYYDKWYRNQMKFMHTKFHISCQLLKKLKKNDLRKI